MFKVLENWNFMVIDTVCMENDSFCWSISLVASCWSVAIAAEH